MLSKSVRGGDSSHLPEYENPPVNEVVLDVQFESIPNFSLDTGLGFWEKLKKDYPTRNVGHPLPPHQTSDEQQQFPFAIETNLNNSPDLRLLFFTKDNATLIQLQSDRFIINWRKTPENSEYLRFNNISKEYHRQFEALNAHIKKNMGAGINANYAEVRYSNFIEFAQGEDISDWFKINKEFISGTEVLHFTLNERVFDAESKEKESGIPIAHFVKNIRMGAAQIPDDDHNPPQVKSYRIRNAAQLNLSFSGPINEHVDLKQFFLRGRDKIVTIFDEMTTSHAHNAWGRKERK